MAKVERETRRRGSTRLFADVSITSYMVWMVMVDSMIVDIRHIPRELQEAAFA